MLILFEYFWGREQERVHNAGNCECAAHYGADLFVFFKQDLNAFNLKSRKIENKTYSRHEMIEGLSWFFIFDRDGIQFITEPNCGYLFNLIFSFTYSPVSSVNSKNQIYLEPKW